MKIYHRYGTERGLCTLVCLVSVSLETAGYVFMVNISISTRNKEKNGERLKLFDLHTEHAV